MGFAQAVPEALTALVEATLLEQRLSAQHIDVWTTPRRIALRIVGLPTAQPARVLEVKGPPIRTALDAQGQPTPAGLGFAKKQGVPFEALVQEAVQGETYLVCRRTESGRDTSQVLSECIPAWVLGLSGAHFMRWADLDVKFSRPIRWLVALLDEAIVPVSLAGVTSNRLSYGHRVLSPQPVSIASAQAYLDTLALEGHVWVDPHVRRAQIRAQLLEAAQRETPCQTLAIDEDLLETLVHLVEWPSVVVGNFDAAYLDLPSMVISTVMKAHQKFHPVVEAGSGVLSPMFLSVSNARPEAKDVVRAGNQRVLAARLADARFFYEDDLKHPLATRGPLLAGMTFQKGLGTMGQKTQRLVQLVSQLPLAPLGIDAATPETDLRAQAQRAAELAKLDLATAMVRELTELQGQMGQQYALKQGESPAVAWALAAQYGPAPGDDVAPYLAPVALLLNVAEKLDTLVGVFSLPDVKLPTGSRDPLGLRRLSAQLIHLLLAARASASVVAMAQQAYDGYAGLGLKQLAWPDTWQRLEAFLNQRLKTHWQDTYRADMVEAVVAVGLPWENLYLTHQRLVLLAALSPDALQQLAAPAVRIQRILKQMAVSEAMPHPLPAPNPALFQDPCEGLLWETQQQLFTRWQPGQPPENAAALVNRVAVFFERVLVNDPAPEVRRNRQLLLAHVSALYTLYADFGRLQGPAAASDACEAMAVVP